MKSYLLILIWKMARKSKKKSKGSPGIFLALFLLIALLGSMVWHFLIPRVPHSSIKVSVLNGTDVSGLARKTTEILRDKGFDVIEYGNSRTKMDKTIIIDHYSLDMIYGRIIGRALGCRNITTNIDSSQIVNVSIIIGDDYRSAIKGILRREFVF